MHSCSWVLKYVSTACRLLLVLLPLQGRCWIEGDNAPMSGDSKSAFGPVSMRHAAQQGSLCTHQVSLHLSRYRSQGTAHGNNSIAKLCWISCVCWHLRDTQLSPCTMWLAHPAMLARHTSCCVLTCLLQVHLGLLEGRVTHIVWPPARMGRVAVQEQPARLLQTDRRHV